MVGSSNIYVSAAHARSHAGDEDDERYHREQLIWIISVEPLKHHIPFTSKHPPESTHYYATRADDEDAYHVHTHTMDDIIGTVLVKESAHGDAETVKKALEAGLKPASTSVPSEQAADGDSDRWIRKGLHALQAQKLAEDFHVAEFMTFAHGYFVNRLDGDVPAKIAYAGVHKEHKEKLPAPGPHKDNKEHKGKAKRSFWLSYPTKRPNSGDPESRIYGGLM